MAKGRGGAFNNVEIKIMFLNILVCADLYLLVIILTAGVTLYCWTWWWLLLFSAAVGHLADSATRNFILLLSKITSKDVFLRIQHKLLGWGRFFTVAPDCMYVPQKKLRAWWGNVWGGDTQMTRIFVAVPMWTFVLATVRNEDVFEDGGHKWRGGEGRS